MHRVGALRQAYPDERPVDNADRFGLAIHVG
jgi:hypothetical protein